MFSIGDLSRETGVKVPTIRYYEDQSLLEAPERSEGGQRRYDKKARDRLSFIKHARDLGFPLEAIRSLIGLQSEPDRCCREASEIAKAQLAQVQAKIARLKTLESELTRITEGCDGDGAIGQCYVLNSLADHRLCEHEHQAG